jgi:hypothetical protein
LAFSLVLGACGNPKEACQAVIAHIEAPADGHVEYEASASGDAALTAVVYDTPAGPVTAPNPPGPFSVGADLELGDSIEITAIGTTRDGGKINVSFEFMDAAGGDPLQAAANCGQ